MIGSSDENQLALTTRRQGAILTKDADFLRLHARGVPHAGIVYAPQDRSIGEIVRGLLRAERTRKGCGYEVVNQ